MPEKIEKNENNEKNEKNEKVEKSGKTSEQPSRMGEYNVQGSPSRPLTGRNRGA